MPKRILVIDDEWSIQRVLDARLRSWGFEVELASDAAAGLASARARTPDAVLLDVRMPGVDGFEVMREFQKDPALRAIPVVFLSANVLDTVRHRALSMGAVAFLAKPYDAATLQRVIEEAMKKAVAPPKKATTNPADSESAGAAAKQRPIPTIEITGTDFASEHTGPH